ncbi:MAG: transposase [Zoogloeaceae bacterium]|nr:transposase [Zoogloeaceae bacterium]
MKIVGTKAITGRRRRTYSAEFKREVVAACRREGASVAGVALSHGINANVVHRWLREAAGASRAFVPVAFDLPAAPTAMAAAPSAAEIRIEVERGESRVVVRWPLAGAGDCAAWLAEWLA